MKHSAYTTAHADPQRSSWVDVEPKPRYEHLERLVLDGPHRLEGVVTEVLADATRVAIRYGIRTVVLEPYGSRELFAAEDGGYWVATLTPDAFVLGARVHPWDGRSMHELPPTSMFAEPVHQWIGWRQGPLWWVGVHEQPAWGPESVGIALVDVEARDEDDDDDDPPSGRTLWTFYRSRVDGTAVRRHDGRVLVSTRDQRIAVVGPEGDPSARDDLSRPLPRIVTDRHADGFVWTCSAVPPGFALLATQDERPSSDAWLIALDEGGAERWRAPVPFRVDVEAHPQLHRPPQPPVAVGDGRILVAGAGLACFAEGKLDWKHSSDQRVGATVLGSKIIAVASGRHVQIVRLDGTVRETVELPGTSRATTPPAVAPDGTLYVGTETDVWAIR